MSPLPMIPLEWRAHTSSRTTETVPLTDAWLPVDEWADEHLTGRPPVMSIEELTEAATLLGDLHHLVGQQAEEVMVFLADLLADRGDGAMQCLRWLRRVDGSARS